MSDCLTTDDDFNLRTPTNNASIELKKKAATKKKKVTWTGYRCRSCGSRGSSPYDVEIPFTECPFCYSSDIETYDSNSNKKL